MSNADLRVAVKERSRRKEISRQLARLQVVLDGRAQFLERSPMSVNPKTGPDSLSESDVRERVVMVDGFMPPIPEVLAAVLANRAERRCEAEGKSRASALEKEPPAVVSVLEKRWAVSRPDLSSLAAECLRLRESTRENYLNYRCQYSGVVCTAGGKYLTTSASEGEVARSIAKLTDLGCRSGGRREMETLLPFEPLEGVEGAARRLLRWDLAPLEVSRWKEQVSLGFACLEERTDREWVIDSVSTIRGRMRRGRCDFWTATVNAAHVGNSWVCIRRTEMEPMPIAPKEDAFPSYAAYEDAQRAFVQRMTTRYHASRLGVIEVGVPHRRVFPTFLERLEAMVEYSKTVPEDRFDQLSSSSFSDDWPIPRALEEAPAAAPELVVAPPTIPDVVPTEEAARSESSESERGSRSPASSTGPDEQEEEEPVAVVLSSLLGEGSPELPPAPVAPATTTSEEAPAVSRGVGAVEENTVPPASAAAPANLPTSSEDERPLVVSSSPSKSKTRPSRPTMMTRQASARLLRRARRRDVATCPFPLHSSGNSDE